MKGMSFPAVLIVMIGSLGLYGCSQSTPAGSATSNPSSDTDELQMQHGNHFHGDHDHEGGGMSDMDKMTAELAKLSSDDRATAENQHFCPVSGEMLGTMGAPQKIDVNGQQVWICCDGCKDRLLANPSEYLAKLR